jgi:tRNA U34 5-carboxymethylaminomethyl modifying GTPase MnmE/TrmE
MEIDFTAPEEENKNLEDKNEKLEELKRILRKLKDNREKKSLLTKNFTHLSSFLRRRENF